MSRIKIDRLVERRLYSEAMGRCMNPNCQVELFINDGDMIEKAHIDPYCETKDNAFENLVILCPNCHTNFDKNHLFTEEQIREWKRIRQEENDRFFSKKFSTFNELQREVVPLLLDNKSIFENCTDNCKCNVLRTYTFHRCTCHINTYNAWHIDIICL